MKLNIMNFWAKLIKMRKYFLILFIFISSPSFALDDKAELLEITKNLRCLVCQGQSIADSNSDFASTIKLVVKDQLEKGKNKKEVYTFLVSKYGEWIVYKPPFNKVNFVLWLFPYIALVSGGVIIFLFFKKRDNH